MFALLRTFRRIAGSVFFFGISVLFSMNIVLPNPVNAQTSPGLGTAGNFSVLGASTVTNTGPSVVNGNLGVSPNSALVGFPPGQVNGSIHVADANALAAQGAATGAYNALAAQTPCTDLSGQNLGGMQLTQGVYCFNAAAQLTGTLTLNASGNPAAVFVFQINSALTTASNSSIQIINSGSSCNIWWQVGSSATLGTTTSFAGNLIAQSNITLNTGANVSGRVIALTGAVTMDTNRVGASACGQSAGADTAPPPTTRCTDVNFENPGIIRSHFVNDVDRSSLFCRLLIEPNAGKIGNQSILDLGVIAAVDVYSAAGVTAFVDDVDICLQGSGYLLFLNANDSPRVPQIVTSWSTTAFPGYVCATLHAPGMLVLVRQKPQLVTSAPATGGAAPRRELWTHQAPVPASDAGLELQIPVLNLKAPIMPVGLTWNNQMDAPVGRPSDKVWQSAFWYQYSAVPGTAGTATIAGHYDDTLGRPAVFAYLSDLKSGNLIIAHDPQTGMDSTFVVTEVKTYSDAEVNQPAILSQIFGASFNAQPLLPLDNVSRLTLITCDGTWTNGMFNSRVVVYAVRVATLPNWLY